MLQKKPPLKREVAARKGRRRDFHAKCNFLCCQVETVRRNSLVTLAVRLGLANAGCQLC